MESAAIVYIIGTSSTEIDNFETSLRLLKRHFLAKHPYPVIAITAGVLSGQQQRQISRNCAIPVRFEQRATDIREMAKGTNDLIPDYVEGFSAGYRRAVRYVAFDWIHEIYFHEVDYYLRLHADSFIMSSIDSDPFETMAQGGFVVGHINEPEELEEPDHQMVGLWEKTAEYIRSNRISPTFLNDLVDSNGDWEQGIYHSSFELGRFDWMKATPVANYLHFIDKSWGVEMHGWSVAAIHTLAKAIFLQRDTICLVDEFDFVHQDCELLVG